MDHKPCEILDTELKKRPRLNQSDTRLLRSIVNNRNDEDVNICFFVVLLIEYLKTNSHVIKEFLKEYVTAKHPGPLRKIYQHIFTKHLRKYKPLNEFLKSFVNDYNQTLDITKKHYFELFFKQFLDRAKHHIDIRRLLRQVASIKYNPDIFDNILSAENNRALYPDDILIISCNMYPLNRLKLQYLVWSRSGHLPQVWFKYQCYKILKLMRNTNQLQRVKNYTVPWGDWIPDQVLRTTHKHRFYLDGITEVDYVTMFLLSFSLLKRDILTDIDAMFKDYDNRNIAQTFIRRIRNIFKFIDWYILLSNYASFPANIPKRMVVPDDPDAPDAIILPNVHNTLRRIVGFARRQLLLEIHHNYNSDVDNIVYLIMFMVTLHDNLMINIHDLRNKSISEYIKIIFNREDTTLDKLYQRNLIVIRKLMDENDIHVKRNVLKYEKFLPRVITGYFVLPEERTRTGIYDIFYRQDNRIRDRVNKFLFNNNRGSHQYYDVNFYMKKIVPEPSEMEFIYNFIYVVQMINSLIYSSYPKKYTYPKAPYDPKQPEKVFPKYTPVSQIEILRPGGNPYEIPDPNDPVFEEDDPYEPVLPEREDPDSDDESIF